MAEFTGLFTGVMIVGYVILALLTVCVVIKIASVYASYKGAQMPDAAIESKDTVGLVIEQDQAEVTILCKQLKNIPQEQEEVVVAESDEEA